MSNLDFDLNDILSEFQDHDPAPGQMEQSSLPAEEEPVYQEPVYQEPEMPVEPLNIPPAPDFLKPEIPKPAAQEPQPVYQNAPLSGSGDLRQITAPLPAPEEISDEMRAIREEAGRQRSLFDDYRELEEASAGADTAEGGFAAADPLDMPVDIHVIVNGDPITMKGKNEYVFVDIFDYIDFDLKDSAGRGIVTQVNGASPDYMQKLYEGDKIEVYWKENSSS